MHGRFLRWFASAGKRTAEGALNEIVVFQFAQVCAAGSDEVTVGAEAGTDVSRITPSQVIIQHVMASRLKLPANFVRVHFRHLRLETNPIGCVPCSNSILP